MTPTGRIAAAIDLLADIEAFPRKPADAVASDFFRNRRYIGSSDRRAVSDIVWRILRRFRRLEWWLARQRAEASPRLLVAASLLLDGGQMNAIDAMFSGGRHAPAPLTAAEAGALAGLVGHTLEHPAMPEAVRFEVPDWLLPHLRARFEASLPAELDALSEPAPLDLRVNLLVGTREDARSVLAAEGIAAEPTPLSPWGLRVLGRRAVTSGDAFKTGLVEIQDEGSQLVAALVDARPGMRVADWCAGAGGKTLAMAMTMQNRGHLAACDVSAPRLDGAVRRLRRAGVHNVERHVVEAGDKWAKRRAATFDRVLVDAPCTGVGTWRRNPDARRRLTETDLEELSEKQAGILDQAALLVRKGGRLVYATCSLLTQENEGQVIAFLSRHADYTVRAYRSAWVLHSEPPSGGDYLALTPARHGTDGFFAAVLERQA